MRFNRSDLADFSYFLTVARHLNFRRAGLELGISASAVSHALKALEGRVGVRLVNRTNRSVTLTAAGEELRNKLERPFEEIRHATEVLDRFRDSPSGLIRINVPAGAVDLLLTPILPVFFERYPDIVLDMSVSDKMIDIVGSGFDAGLRYGGTVPEDMVAQRLTSDPKWIVAASPDYLAKAGVPQIPSDLVNHRCLRIRVGDGSIYRWEFERQGEEISLSVPGPLILDDGTRAMNLALAGFGLVYMNEWDVRDHLEAGRLVTVLDDWSSVGEGYHMYYSSRRQLPKGIRLLIDLIRELKPLGYGPGMKLRPARNLLFLNDGKNPGTFIDATETHLPATDDQTEGVALADMDGDSDLDVVLASPAHPNRLLLNDGAGRFTDASDRLDLRVPMETRDVHVLDVNKDGLNDIAFFNITSNNMGWDKDPQTRLLVNNGSGKFIDETEERLPAHRFSSWAGRVVDFNNDGAPDFLVSSIEVPGFVPLQVKAWQNDGTGKFTDVTSTVIPGITIGRGWSMGKGDLDGDGKDDVMVGGWGTQARLLLTDVKGYEATLPPHEEIRPASK